MTQLDLFGETQRVFTIPPGAPFLPTLCRALLGGTLVPGFAPLADPLALAGATVLVPTRRAARALATTLATEAGAPAMLLPRILPLGALEAIETDLLFDETAFDAPLAADLPDAIAPITRRMILTRLILQWAQAVRRAIVAVERDGTRTLHPHEELLVAASPADAWSLAGDLAALNDDFALEGVDWSRLAPLGTDAFDQYWRITLDFLGIVMQSWPTLLAERGEVDAAQRQIALIDAEIARLQRGAGGPVIVAGSTGSSPPTARLIAAIARLPQGAVVLPGLDQALDRPGWTAIGPETASHPQAALKRLLGSMGIDRGAVRPLGEVARPLSARARFVSQALRPAGTTDLWQAFAGTTRPSDRDAALAGLTLIEAADERQEALALAVTLREALEGPGTAVLVTPDRGLGLRVREELARWGIDIDASSGEPLGTTPAGTLARLVIDAAVQDLAPVEVLALLAHPLARFGRTRSEVGGLARTLEIAILRGVLPPRALHEPAGLIARARAMQARGLHLPDPLKRLRDEDFTRLTAFLGEVVAALAPVRRLGSGTPLPDWLAAHAAVVEAVAAMPDEESALTGIDGNALVSLFEALAEAPEPAIRLDAAGYAALFDRFAAEMPVRGPNRSHPRVKILGLLEARLLSADLVLLGGLDEGIWPPQSRTDAFLNRPMRASLGLPPPERRIGQTAHDLSMLMGAPRVVLSRAVKRGGTPTVPSRFLLRMGALAGESWNAARARGAVLLDLAAALDRSAEAQSIPRPAPKPDMDLRPASLSVTRIETLRRDPYAIYAERILRLVPAEPIGAVIGPRESGTLFHDVMARFVREAPGALHPEAEATLLAATEAAFADACDDPQFRSFHWPRIRAWVRAFVAWDAEQRAGAPTLEVEANGRLRIPLVDGSVFDLTAYADRIENDGGLVRVIDYKTGRAPSPSEVKVGFAPQLTLEAAMIERGAFAAFPAGTRVQEALYLKFEAKGGLRGIKLEWRDRAFADVVADHVEGLTTLLNAFRDPTTGYMARPFPQFASRFNPYDHLARVKEWSAGGLDEEEG